MCYNRKQNLIGPELTVRDDSYEALPSNYGLGRNMLAGAFAGIAVRYMDTEKRLVAYGA
jgi:hypothetical protein